MGNRSKQSHLHRAGNEGQRQEIRKTQHANRDEAGARRLRSKRHDLEVARQHYIKWGGDRVKVRTLETEIDHEFEAFGGWRGQAVAP